MQLRNIDGRFAAHDLVLFSCSSHQLFGLRLYILSICFLGKHVQLCCKRPAGAFNDLGCFVRGSYVDGLPPFSPFLAKGQVLR